MVFKMNAPLYAMETQRREGEDVLYVNFMGAPYAPSIAANPDVMGRTIDVLVDNPNVSRIVFVQQRNYHYPHLQVAMLREIAHVYTHLLKQERVLSPEKLQYIANVQFAMGEMQYLMGVLRQDPVACYMELKRRVKQYRAEVSGGSVVEEEGSRLTTYARFLQRILDMLAKTALIKAVEDTVDTFIAGDREVYADVFRAEILPNFTFTRLVAALPKHADLIDQYEINYEDEEIPVTILRKEGDSRSMYHIMPPEYILSEEHHMLLNLARNVLIEHEPKAEDYTDPMRVRAIFFNIARDMLSELARSENIALSYRELQRLARILVRQTIGFGLIEVLLMDDKLQDVFLNAPIAQNPVFVQHAKHENCVTNVIPSYTDADSWAAKLRLQSGRPLDEANPVLDTDISFGGVRARVAAIQKPLSPQGVAYALRRHRDDPWTLPLFIKTHMLNSFTAGLLHFLIDGGRTILIAGTRSSGKTSLLGSLMLSIMPRIRSLVVEDTLELPVDALQKLGYDVQRMKVRSALLEGTSEVEAAEGIRTSLRLGDSSLIVGEVRSAEAKALYEAMRVGALANVVAGTIHGASPYGVFDRVVNDLGVPLTSFKATDIIVVANPIKTADGLHAKKRVLQVTEVRKHWTHDPLVEKGFVDLVKYNVEKDELEPSDDLINGNSEIVKAIAGNVKGWAGNWDAVYDNIILRGKMLQAIVDEAEKYNQPELLEGAFFMRANDAFHTISEQAQRDHGLPLEKYVLPAWKQWLRNAHRTDDD